MKMFITFLIISFVFVSVSNEASAYDIRDIQNFLTSIDSGNCQIKTQPSQNRQNQEVLSVNLLNKTTAQEESFIAQSARGTNGVEVKMTKNNKSMRFDYSEVFLQDATFGSDLKEYVNFSVVVDSRNAIQSIQYVVSKDVRGWFGVSEKIVTQFECKE